MKKSKVIEMVKEDLKAISKIKKLSKEADEFLNHHLPSREEIEINLENKAKLGGLKVKKVTVSKEEYDWLISKLDEKAKVISKLKKLFKSNSIIKK